MAYLPRPETFADIKTTIDSAKANSPVPFKYMERNTLQTRVRYALYPNGLNQPMVTGAIPATQDDYLNAYSITRSMVQCGEAINKLASILKLLYMSRAHIADRICPSTRIAYSGGTIIPTLYYSNLSALTSLMSSFGCVPIRDRNTGHSLNLVRTGTGWKVYGRTDYITRLLGSASRGWHIQVAELVEGLKSHVADFPDIDLDRLKRMSSLRDKTHYEILGSLTMTRVGGLHTFFDVLRTTVNTINYALMTISSIYQQHGLAGFNRFREAHGNLGILYNLYGRPIPPTLLPLQF